MIANFKNLAENSLRKKTLLIAEAGYEAIDIKRVVSGRCKVLSINNKNFLVIKSHNKEEKINLNNFERIFIVGIGKGSALASASLAKILGDKLTKIIALDITKPKFLNPKFLIMNSEFLIGAHPLPSKQNIKATQKIIKLAKSLNKKDLLITFICGGGSALVCASKQELKTTTWATQKLTKAGANINELNTVRKHLSEFKGGGLAKIACPATVFSLIVSDVCGNDLSTVASGPTVYDKTAKKDAENILKKYGLNPKKIKLYETPKEKRCFKKVKNILFVCNQDAIEGMINHAGKLGFSAKIQNLALQGEAKTAFLPMLKKVKNKEVLLAAGETTVALQNKKSGKGGRNQEAVLGAIVEFSISNYQFPRNLVIISFASDSRDNTETAGAIADFSTIKKAEKLKLNPRKYLNEHDSFNFFKKTGDLIFAEQKSFNVADLMIVMKKD